MAQPEIVPEPTRFPEPAAVASRTSAAPPVPEPAAANRRERLAGGLIALLTIAGIVLCWLLIGQLQANRALEGMVTTLEGEVLRAEASVAAHQLRLEQVRHQVGGLASQVGALQALVEGDIEPRPAAPPPGPTSRLADAPE